ncbi:Proteasome Adapter And Scaffold Protein Ecm29 [Manis pentadactyla]|nr:Proteasome Adapter And Scaffold Protein Ecm29 [Manis pentadactyla]
MPHHGDEDESDMEYSHVCLNTIADTISFNVCHAAHTVNLKLNLAIALTSGTPKPNLRPDPWTRYFTFNIDINNDSLNPLTRSQTCPDIRIADYCPVLLLFIDFSFENYYNNPRSLKLNHSASAMMSSDATT